MKACALVAASLLSACTDAATDPVVIGPFTGAQHRFVVDSFRLPMNSTDAHAVAWDLDGDGNVDNQLGMVIGTLGSEGDVTADGADMIASGAIASTVVVQADDLVNDDRVGVGYVGNDADLDATVVVGGRIVDRGFISNLALSRAPGAASLDLPVFVGAAPSAIRTHALQITLTPDADGRGGYTANIAAAITSSELSGPLIAGIGAMLAADPQGHRLFAQVLDADRDGKVTAGEILNNELVRSLTAPDIALRDGTPAISFAYSAHLTPCDSGACIAAPPVHPCGDRVLDGDETDVDCGGSCGACPGAATCVADADCQSHACGADHACVAPSCSDGVRDGFEAAIDCGGGGACAGCATGVACVGDIDCASGHCDFTGAGTCL